MKINRICFETIGPFKKATLDFKKGSPGLHVVYGANESGKSSALRYVLYFLFGIPVQNEEDFQFDYRNFLIEAELQTANGPAVFRRIKKNKENLLLPDGSDGTEILEKMLGRVGAPEFQRLFGMSHAQLRHGAADLLNGEGDLAKAIFQAGSGMFNLARVQQALEESVKKGKKSIKGIVESYKSCLDVIKSSRVERDVWEGVFNIGKELKVKAENLEKEIAELKGRRAKCQKTLRVLPNLTRRKNALDRLQALESIPLIAETELSSYESASRKLESAKARLEQIQKQIADVSKQRTAITVNEKILSQETAIQALNQALGQLDELLKSHPKRLMEKEAAETTARNLAKDLSGHENLEQVVALIPTLTARHEILEVHRKIETQAALIFQKAGDRAKEDARLEQIKAKIAELKPHPEREKIGSLIHAVKNANVTPLDLKASGKALASRKNQVDGNFNNLPLWKGTWQQMLEAKFPSRERLEEFQKESNRLETRRNSLLAEILSKSEVTSDKQQQIARDQSHGALPTHEDLIQLRQSRTLAWNALEAGSGQPEVKSSLGDGTSSKEAFLALLTKTDELADTMLSLGERIGKLKQLKIDIQGLDKQVEKSNQELEGLTAGQKQLAEEWKALWEETGLSHPGSPGEMIPWLGKANDWKKEYRDFEPAWREFKAMEGQQANLIKQAMAFLPLQEPDLGIAWGLLENFVQNEGVRNASHQDQLHQEANTGQDLAVIQDELTRLKRDKEELNKIWMVKLASLHLPAGTGGGSVAKCLDTIETFKGEMVTAKEAGKRAEKIEADIKGIQAQLAGVLKALSVQKETTDPTRIRPIVEQLIRDLEKEKQGQANLQRTVEEIDKQEKSRQKEEAELSTLRGSLAHLAKILGNIPVDEVAIHFDAIRKKAGSSKDMKDAEGELEKDTSGNDLKSFCLQMEGIDDTQVRGEEDQLEKKIVEKETELKPYNISIGENKKELADLEKKQGSFDKVADLETEKALCLEQAREVAQHELARLVLQEATRLYREKNQDPILKNAKPHFETLTLGRYVNIDPTDKDGIPVLQVVRKDDGAEIGFTGKHLSPRDGGNTALSDGTADQLFLALRLGAIEEHLKKLSEPVPVILDDILIQFSDDRAIPALDCLAELSQKTQVILFTHHQHLEKLIPQCRHKDWISFQELRDSPS